MIWILSRALLPVPIPDFNFPGPSDSLTRNKSEGHFPGCLDQVSSPRCASASYRFLSFYYCSSPPVLFPLAFPSLNTAFLYPRPEFQGHRGIATKDNPMTVFSGASLMRPSRSRTSLNGRSLPSTHLRTFGPRATWSTIVTASPNPLQPSPIRLPFLLRLFMTVDLDTLNAQGNLMYYSA